MPVSGSPQQIVHEEMHRFKHGQLHSGSARGPKVKSRAQAIAIALSEARKHRDMGGAASLGNPVQAVINALQAGGGYGATPGANSQSPMGNTTQPAPVATSTAGLGTPAPQSGVQANTGLGTMAPRATVSQTQTQPMGFAFGGSPSPPWFVRNEARQLNHFGPVASAVPGRTDRHNINVPSGSYVLPAETVSHLGQSNSIAGLKIADRMFGTSGPYGAALPHIGHGMGLPRPPKPMGVMADEGGSRGEGKDQSSVPVVVAGGEYIVHPSVVRAIGAGDIKRGHHILDNFVMAQRKDHLKTISKLKPPVKS